MNFKWPANLTIFGIFLSKSAGNLSRLGATCFIYTLALALAPSGLTNLLLLQMHKISSNIFYATIKQFPS